MVKSFRANRITSFISRFVQYQSERFPFVRNGLVIGMFTFSSISFSRLSRGLSSFIALPDFLVGVFTTITIFFLLRIADEFKDNAEDCKYRPDLPVPRGLISLRELGVVAFVMLVLQVILIGVVHPQMYWSYGIVLVYMILMRYEFFVPDWLIAHHWIYVMAHMLIVPLVDVYSSGLDWYADDVRPPLSIALFFIISFLNGILIEIGRKIKAPQDEREGVLSYTKYFGTKRAIYVYTLLIALVFGLCTLAVYTVGLGIGSMLLLCIGLLIGLVSPVAYLRRNLTPQWATRIEAGTGIWTLLMYAALGGLPGFVKLINF